MGKQVLRLLTLVASFVWGAQALAQSPDPNGCGSSLSHYVVPDRLAGCELKGACDAHDICYARCITPTQIANDGACFYRTCEAGGSNAATSACSAMKLDEMMQAREERKLKCDKKLFGDIKDNNQQRMVCRAIGRTYEVAVLVLGSGSFMGTTVSVGNMSDQQRSEYKNALDAFFANATEADLADFEVRSASASSGLDLSKALRYDPASRRLVNVITSGPNQ
jgi:hypothetical protein